jgi:hypothetical protein
MDNNKYDELIGRLNQYLYADRTGRSVSPKSSGRDGESLSDNLLITKDLQKEQSDKMASYLAHSLNERKDLNEKIKTEQVIHRVNKYLTLMRYKYAEVEKLKRLRILNDYYCSMKEQSSNESLGAKIEVAEKLSVGLILPLKVRGIFLTEGRPAKRFYSSIELRKAVNNPINQKFPIMLDHRDNEVSAMVGAVDKLEYDPVIKGIRYWGHINDETFARNVMDGVITDVSATIFAKDVYDASLGKIGTDLTFKELSLVVNGAEPMNLIEVDR